MLTQRSEKKRSAALITGTMLVMAALALIVMPASLNAQNYNWKITQGIAEDHPATDRCKQFAELVKKETNGRIKMQYFPAGALGDWMEQIESNRMGTLEIGLNAGSTSYDPKTNLIFMPYLFESWDEARAGIGSTGWLTPIFDDLYSQIGLKVLGIYLNAWDGFAFAKRVTTVPKTPAEFKGIKMRVAPIRIFEVYIPSLGFISTPIAYSETFTALQTGIVDARSACPAVEAYVMRDALRSYVLARDAFEYWFLTMNLDLWNTLSKEDQAILLKAADKVMADQAHAAEQDELDFLKKLEDAGIQVHISTKEEWMEAAKIVRQQAWPKIENELLGSELMEQVKKFATKLD
ncbi:MAG: TRAP transporter substrate-binding protein DctP [Syntrophales bacterium]|jgi:TRAP-type C4-dicarboxylate transport system substrate-binding protein|nr:TRAP transporter substrate-binding protein DctP [Syntrophales bacterium]MCK9527366.1 TRAP transporter substrate-binding protein DctP [Syntrophales bacterium]MDX9921468.1 TRAP transporter substrate-binding protein DctP [Syntrophales bacterium]